MSGLDRVIKLGSRKSELALTQTNLIVDLLKETYDGIKVEIITMDTIGDKVLDVALSKIGDKSLFTKELELALLTKEVDLVVHSLKDVSTTLSDNFVLGCVCMRESNEDVVVMKRDSIYKSLDELPVGSIIGTSSVRRVASLKMKYGDKLQFESIRGNLNTRFLKLDDPIEAQKRGKGNGTEYAAIIIAKAGIERLGWQQRITQVLRQEDNLYAVGQGALAIECRVDDTQILDLLSRIHDEPSCLTTMAERALMCALDGGCSTPIGVRTRLVNLEKLILTGCVMSVDGSESVTLTMETVLPLDMNPSDDDDTISMEEPVAKRPRRNFSQGDINKSEEYVFMGVKVEPICSIGRRRMAASRELGRNLATRLLEKGADRILANIIRPDHNLLHNPKHDLITSQKVLHQSTSSISSTSKYSQLQSYNLHCPSNLPACTMSNNNNSITIGNNVDHNITGLSSIHDNKS